MIPIPKTAITSPKTDSQHTRTLYTNKTNKRLITGATWISADVNGRSSFNDAFIADHISMSAVIVPTIAPSTASITYFKFALLVRYVFIMGPFHSMSPRNIIKYTQQMIVKKTYMGILSRAIFVKITSVL